MSVPPRITLVTLGVRDVAAATAFYQRLGWRLSSEGNERVSFFALDGIVLAVWSRAELAGDAMVEDTPPGFGGIALAINLASRDEVDAAMAAAEAAGARITKAAQPVFWGGYSGYFADLDGHLWEVAHNPFWPLDENGQAILPE
jgi:hypothetical protein